MTRKVEVDADDLDLAVNGKGDGSSVFAAFDRLRAALTPPQPTLRDALEAAIDELWMGRNATSVAEITNAILPIVEAAVSEAADGAWNAARREAERMTGCDLSGMRGM